LLEEFEALAKTAEYNVVGTFDVVGPSSARFGIKGGKVEEIRIWIEAQKPDVVFYSPGLKSSQMYRLKEEWKTDVRDRVQLILEIFDRHARTPQSKLQIEQARLSYELPFVRHQLKEHLDKERAGPRPVGRQVGPGEDLLNLRYMEIRHRVAAIEEKLQKISEASELKRKKRVDSGFLEVALAGYTNAGKSTLHRALTGSQVEVAAGLFTTLSTKSSDLAMDGRQVVLTDSVGFISDLPKSLLRAFNTTLMEIADADVILLVVDGSNSVDEVRRKANVCLDTFTRIGINGIPIVTALNKVDLIDDAGIRERISALDGVGSEVVPVSAKEMLNLPTLVSVIESLLPILSVYSIDLPYGDSTMSLISWLHQVGSVRNQKFKEDRIEVEASLSLDVAQKLLKMLPQDAIRKLEPKSDNPAQGA